MSTLEAQDRMLERLEIKLEKPVLNGGFDTLVSKVDKIESVSEQMRETQAVANKKIDAIHTVVMDPDTGLYHQVKSHSSWIESTSKGLKWFGGLFIAGVLTGIGKLIYDFTTNHIHVTP